MTGPERVAALVRSVWHLENAGIAGDIGECGVWRGGSMMAVALALLARQATQRRLVLFDTFAGMPPPEAVDRDLFDQPAAELLAASDPAEAPVWARCPLDLVRRAMSGTGYPVDRLRFVHGCVEETLPDAAPARIALLRLDTDWYASTRHELVHLFPRLVPGGILIIDDYGHWQGARRAVDEYFAEQQIPLELHALDYTCRIAVKP
jgi:hypothetical protein